MVISNISKLTSICHPRHHLHLLLLVRSVSSTSVPSHDHITHLLLEQKSAIELIDTFRWASELPSFAHSPSTYRALIHKLCSFRRFDTAYEVLDQMPHSIDDHILVTLIRGLARAHLLKQVVNVLHLAAKYNPKQKPSLKVYNSILDVLVKADIDIAREFYRKKMMGTGVVGDNYTYGILMKGLCLTNRIGEGFKLLQGIKSRGVAPNTVVYNTLLHALCRNGKVGRARSLMNEMKEPNDVTFNILIASYCGEENLVQAVVMLEKCFGSGYVPDVVTVTKVLEVLCNVGRVMEAVKVVERVESNGGLVDVVAYNTLVKGFCRLGKVKLGHRILKEMERKGCLPNADTYNALILGLCEAGMLDKALDLFNDMKTDEVTWNFATYDTLIRGLCSGGRTEDGLKILDLMNESKDGCRGRISPFNSVLYGMYKENRLDEALELLGNLNRLFPRAVDRSLQILGFCEEGEIENAKKIYDQMIVERAVPCVLIYDYLIRRFCQEGCVRQAFELMNEMIGHCYFPVASTFNVLINGFCEQGKVGSALKLLEEMVSRGCLPDIESYNHLVGALCRKGDFQKALKLVLQMVGKGITPVYFTWNSLLLCSSREAVWLNSRNMFYVSNQLDCLIRA